MRQSAAATGLATVLATTSPLMSSVAFAQPAYGQSQYSQDRNNQDRYDNDRGNDDGDARRPPPPGYEPGYAYGDTDVAPPEGYSDRDRYYDFSDRARGEDQRYSRSVERWAEENCIDQRNNQVAGAVIGGILGAIIGSNVAGRHSRTGGAVVGGALGAMAGSAIGASSTSPGCPPGFVVRRGASPFAAPVFVGGYAYVAPPGYRPWIWTGSRWGYRPYPYHRYWYRYERQRYRNWRDR